MRTLPAAVAAAVLALAGSSSAPAQSDRDMAQMQLYVQELEEQVRLLTGENERLLHELRTLRAATGQAEAVQSGQTEAAAAGQAEIVTGSTMAPGGPGSNASVDAGAAPRDLGTLIVTETGGDGTAATEQGPLPSFDQPQVEAEAPPIGENAPVDLSALAGGATSLQEAPGTPRAGAPAGAVPQTQAALPGGSRQAYDVAYGYVLTGDYDAAEEQFRRWLDTYPGDPQAPDARFWLGESQFQQGKHRDAANTLLALYRDAPGSRKAPDALMKLGMSLAALGETDAACSTFAEMGKRHPDAPASVAARVAAESDRAGC